MNTFQERLLQLDRDLLSGNNICSSRGVLNAFPSSLKKLFLMRGLGLIICRQGNFQFALNQRLFRANAGETLFIPEDSHFQVLQESEDMEVFILAYQIQPIRDIIGNSVVSMYMYSQLIPEPCYVWTTGEETGGRKNEIFVRLIQLIEQYYMKERGVGFYADKLCLSPKYLSALAKNICGYTVQELVFKAIIRKSISLLKNTQKDILEISNELNFPNASYFGTFFKKQMGMSPQQYRRNL